MINFQVDVEPNKMGGRYSEGPRRQGDSQQVRIGLGRHHQAEELRRGEIQGVPHREVGQGAFQEAPGGTLLGPGLQWRSPGTGQRYGGITVTCAYLFADRALITQSRR